MQKEIEVAVKWWTDQLVSTGDKHDNGEDKQSAFANLVSRNLPPVTETQRNDFAESLQSELEERLKTSAWDVEKPEFGSYSRAFGCDYQPAELLRDALLYAGISAPDLRLPIKTTMWINPGEVKVSCGYRSPIEVIYQEEAR